MKFYLLLVFVSILSISSAFPGEKGGNGDDEGLVNVLTQFALSKECPQKEIVNICYLAEKEFEENEDPTIEEFIGACCNPVKNFN